MFTKKATFYFLLAIVLLTLALVLRDFQLGILTLGLACLFFLSNIWGLPEKVDLRLTRHISPDETFGNEAIIVESRIQNMTDSDLRNVEFDETLPNRLVPEKGTNQLVSTLKPSETESLEMTFPPPPRANYQIGPLIVRAQDPFGFYLVEKVLDPEILSVVPRPERIRGAQLRTRHVLHWPGTIPSKAIGIGTEYYDLRPYVPGDDPKRINWKASARRAELMINETEAERVTDVMIVLDTDVTASEPVEDELFEREVHAASSIASMLLRQGNRVGLVLQGGERGSLPAGFGKRHERKILYLLAEASPGRSSVPTSYVMNLLARRMVPHRSQVVIISSLTDPEVKEGVRELSQAGYDLLVISPTPSPPARFEFESDKIAFNLIMLERSITLMAIERSSTIIDWPRGVPLSVIMSRMRRLRAPVMA